MTPARFVIILVVIVLVLFGISLAVRKSSAGRQTKPTNSWASQVNDWFAARQKLDAQNDVAPRTSDGKWTVAGSPLPVGPQPALSLDIKKSEKKQTIRKAKFVLSPGTFKVKYTPRLDAANKPLDPQAVTLDIEKFDPARGPLSLIFLKNGGTLNVARTVGAGQLLVRVE